MNRLADQIAVVTGASRGIGAALARRLAAEGAHVVLVARTVGGLEEVDDAVKAAGGQATLVPCDLTEFDRIDTLGPALAERFGRCDILVGNAGMLGGLSPLGHYKSETWQAVFDLNVHANWHLIRTLDPLLRAAPAGRAVFVSADVARTPRPYWGAYAAAKAALESMARTWALETAKTPLSVAVLDPGPVATALRAEAYPGEDAATLTQPDEAAEGILQAILGDAAHG